MLRVPDHQSGRRKFTIDFVGHVYLRACEVTLRGSDTQLNTMRSFGFEEAIGLRFSALLYAFMPVKAFARSPARMIETKSFIRPS